MDGYLLLKTVHVLSSTVLFGTAGHCALLAPEQRSRLLQRGAMLDSVAPTAAALRR